MKWLLPLVALCFGLLLGWFFAGTSDTESSRSIGAKESVIGGRNQTIASDGKDAEPVELTKAESSALDAVGMSQEWLAGLEGKDQLDQLSALLERIQRAQPGDLNTLMDAMQKYSGSMSWMAQSILATKWATTDPQGMIAYIESQPTDRQWGLRNAFYGAWAKENPNAAYASALNLGDRRSQQSALQSVIQAIAAKDPQKAIQMAGEMGDLGHRADWLMRNIYSSWAREDLAAARESALALPEGPGKVQALSGAMQNWMHESPFEALDWLDSLPVDGTVYNSKKELFRNLLNRDFETAKSYVEGKVDSVERREILENISFSNLGWQKSFEEIEGMYQWIGEVATGQVYDQKVGEIIRSLVNVDQARAEAFVFNLPAGNARMNAISNLASSIAERDPVAGIAFAMGLAYEDEKERALSHMSWQISRNGVDAVKSLIASAEDPTVQRQMASRIVSDWSKYDQVGALEWAESLSDDNARGQAVQAVYRNWLQADPAAAMAYLSSSVDEGKQSNYLRSGFQEWARQDPAAAVAWLDQIPETIDEKGAVDLYRTVTQTYVQHDPMAASEWITTLDEGPTRDRSVETLVQSISKTDPEAGFIWAATVGYADMRKNTLTRSVREWVKDDPDAAFRAVRDAKITAEEKVPLFEMIEKAK
jgi:hypothetical protein